MRSARPLFAIAVVLPLLGGCPFDYSGLFPPLETVADLDPQQYAGRWYEIARYPNFFEVGCEGVTADYTWGTDGRIGVRNTCRNPDGTEKSQINGFAEVPDPNAPGKLLVYFNAPFGAPYWVLDLDPGYQWAVVGEPSRNTFWILSRTPTLDPDVYATIVAQMPDWGYNPDRLVEVPQPDVE
jgi:apolipoprotein D and lipocalin family protein